MARLQTTNCSMDAFVNSQAPNTALVLSLSLPTSPCKASPPLSNGKAAAFQGSSHSPGPLFNFFSPALPVRSCPKLDQDMEFARSSPPAVQLELLPLRPSPQKITFASSPALHWQQPAMASPSAFPSKLAREIDVNQMPLPASLDRDEISQSIGILTKRERERSSDANHERTYEVVSSRGSDEEGEGGGIARKKLRLSKDQSTLLEESFKEHSTLNPKQKADLAKKLNLSPRQVEVWFQNRRARTKLKQTEVDYELLKKCCESLTEENRRLQKEVQELRALKVAPPCVIPRNRVMPVPATTLSICPSCEHVASHATSPSSSQSSPTSTLSFSLSPSHRVPHLQHPPLPFTAQPHPPPHGLPSAAY